MSSEIEAELVNCGEIEAGLVAAMDPPQNDQITETDSEKIPLLDAKPDTSVTELVPPSESVVALDLHEIKPKNESCSPPTSLETTSLSTDSQLNVQPTFATTNESVVQHELVSPQVTPNPAESVSEQPNAKPSPDFPLIQAVVQVAGYLDIAETPATSETSKTFATSKTASVEEMQVDEPIDYDTSPAPPSTVSSPCSSISSRTSKESDCDSTDPTPAPYFSLTEFFTMMRSEHQRLQTFLSNGFQSKHVTPQSLAKAGFFFMLQADRVMCAFCKMTFWGWHEGSNPIRDHFELNPRCRFLNGCDVGNQPIDKGPIELIRDEFGEIDTGGNGSLNDEPQVSTSNDRTTSAIRSVDSRLVTFDSVDEIGDDELSVTLAERLDPIIPSLPKSASDTMLESIEVVTSSETIPADREQLLAMMANEKDRLRTFDIGNWPAFFINPVELARVGFFYTQARDRVECAFCETFIYDWEPGDRPLLEHIRHSPDCPLLKGEAANNVPIDAKAFERVLSIVETITPDFPFDNSPSTTEYDINSELYMHESYESHPEVTSVNSTRPMVDLRFVTFESRKISFDSWPDDSPLDIEAAAAAGFYSLGVNDYVRCFSCGGCLSDWSPGDDPWTEHAKYFPKCEFLILDHGADFIANCTTDDLKCEHSASISHNPENQYSDNEKRTKKEEDSDSNQDQIEELLSSDIVRELLRLQPTDRDTLKTVLQSRQNSTGRPFDNLAELLESLSEVTSRNSIASQSSSLDDGHIDSETKSASLSAVEGSVTVTSSARSRLIHGSTLTGSTASSLSPATSDVESDVQTPAESTDAFVCKICFDSRLGVLFVPCGHFCACSQCAVALSCCPVCRSSIQKKLSTIF